MVIIGCGSRDWANWHTLTTVMSDLHKEFHFTRVVQGGAQGADTMIRRWAAENNIPGETYKAKWNLHGRGAGPIRNKHMYEVEKPQMLIGFYAHGRENRGTKNMMSLGLLINRVHIHEGIEIIREIQG